MHWARQSRTGELGPVAPLKNRYEGITYPQAHNNLRKLLGKATARFCPCGSPAREWAYCGGDPNERFGPKRPDNPNGIGWGFYSESPNYYEAMCSGCHTQRDGALMRQHLREYRTLLHETGLTYEQMRKALSLG